MGKARGQRVVNFTCFPSNKYQVGRQEPLQGGGGGRGAAGRVAGGSTGQPWPSPPLAVFHSHPYLCPISSVPASSGAYFQAVRDARRDVIFPPGLVKPICWSCRPARGRISRPCLGPGADGERLWGLRALCSRVCCDSFSGTAPRPQVCAGPVAPRTLQGHRDGHPASLRAERSGASSKPRHGWGAGGGAFLEM